MSASTPIWYVALHAVTIDQVYFSHLCHTRPGSLNTILAASYWITKDADHWRGQLQVEGILKAPSAATIRQLTTDHHMQLRSTCWFYGGRKTGEPGEKPSKHRRDQLQQLYSQEFRVFENQHEAIITQVVTPTRLNLEFSGERQLHSLEAYSWSPYKITLDIELPEKVLNKMTSTRSKSHLFVYIPAKHHTFIGLVGFESCLQSGSDPSSPQKYPAKKKKLGGKK